jgi:hypothetical protein
MKLNCIPDYEHWWKSKKLTEDDLICLVMGVCPNAYKIYYQTYQKEIRPEEEHYIIEQFSQYIFKEIPYGKKFEQFYNDFKQRNLWSYEGKKGKESFIKGLYEEGFYLYGYDIHPNFKNYLVNIDVYPSHFSHFENYNLYEYNFISFDPSMINGEDDAIAILFGLESEYLKKFFLNKQDWKDKPSEQKFFERQYDKFLKKKYPEYLSLSLAPDLLLKSASEAAKKMQLWSGNFIEYAQNLYDNGFIFKHDVLKDLRLNLSYSSGSWAEKFYQGWINDFAWTFEQAKLLFKGECPNQKRNFIDLSQKRTYFLNWIYEPNHNQLIDFDERFLKANAAGVINVCGKNSSGENLYKPKEIVLWFIENTQHRPPDILLRLLDIGSISEKTSEVNKIYDFDAMLKADRDKAVLDFAIKVWEENKRPKINWVHQQIEKNQYFKNRKTSWQTICKPITEAKLSAESQSRKNAENRGKNTF